MYSYLMIQNLKDFKEKIELNLSKVLDSGRSTSEIQNPVNLPDIEILQMTNESKYSSPQLIKCSLELKKLNECIKNNKIEKIKCDKLFYDYVKCDETIKIKRFVKYSDK